MLRGIFWKRRKFACLRLINEAKDKEKLLRKYVYIQKHEIMKQQREIIIQ